MKTLYSWYYEKLEHEFGQFNRYHMKILVGDIDNKVMWEDIVKPASKDLEFTWNLGEIYKLFYMQKNLLSWVI